MKIKLFITFAFFAALTWGVAGFSMDHSLEGHAGQANTPEKQTIGHSMPADTFTHHMVVDGIRGEFQVMSLASMNMKDPDGATHHIMVKLFHENMNHQIKNAVGKIKVVGPDEKEQIEKLKNYSGIFAANFLFDKKGQYGVICLVKLGDEKHVFKFWYPHST